MKFATKCTVQGRQLVCLLLLLFGISTLGYAQISVNGTVTSAQDGNPLPGVNVLEKGTLNGTSTDAD